ncbi:MAG: M23 family metallopeptidase [Rikenellaceae bacterium]
MNKLFFALALLFFPAFSLAQTFAPEDFVYPLEDVSRLYSANFGELRSDHFHSGIDIKTEGVTGKKIAAVADGYISRISLSPYGYGLALYVTHPNGTTSVYGHMQEFSDAVTKYVAQERYRTKSQTANLFCSSKQFPVKQGDIIGLSGNSGSSGGPHLHFEIRDSATQEPINVVSHKIITPRDNMAPLIMRVHYIEVDSLQGIARKAPLRSYDVVKNGGNYTILGAENIPVGRKGYFVVEASDRRNDVSNTFGIYNLTASVDGQKYFEYNMDRISFARTRYCNAVGYYPIMIKSRNEALRLSAIENGDLSHYSTIVNRGVVSSKTGQVRNVEIMVKDDCGNASQLNFTIKGKSDDECYKAEVVDVKSIAYAKKQYEYRGDNITVTIPANALYESTIFECEESDAADSTIYSKVFDVLNIDTPLHKLMQLSIAADVPFHLQSKVGVACVSRSGKPSFICGEYRYGSVTVSSRNAGKFYVVADTEPPTLKLSFAEGAQLSESKEFTCAMSDELSGVAKYSATLNGAWIALDLDKGVLTHKFRSEPSGSAHTLIIEATDAVGNKTEITRNFIR